MNQRTQCFLARLEIGCQGNPTKQKISPPGKPRREGMRLETHRGSGRKELFKTTLQLEGFPGGTSGKEYS